MAKKKARKKSASRGVKAAAAAGGNPRELAPLVARATSIALVEGGRLGPIKFPGKLGTAAEEGARLLELLSKTGRPGFPDWR